MKTIFLDFDGVLFDTALEAYLLARYAYYDISPFKKVDEEQYKIFYKNKYLVTNSRQYYFLMKNFDYANINLEEVILQKTVETTAFDIKFQKCRLDLIENYYNFWNNLDTPYPFFYEIKKLINQYNIVIVSTKNINAIDKKLKQHGFNISLDKIIGKEILANYISKGDFISKYIKENNIDNAIVIDDSQENLDSCKSISNIQLLLANWGYCNPKFAGLSCQEIINKIKEGV